MRCPGKEHLPLVALLTGFAILRLLVIPTFGLGVDEAHYVLYGRFLDLSYFDHPPLVGWVQAALAWIFGENLYGARIGATTTWSSSGAVAGRARANGAPSIRVQLSVAGS